jgi:hypothetical protein
MKIQDNQVNVLVDILNGKAVYTTQDVINNTKIPLSSGINDMIGISLTKPSEVATIVGDNIPKGNIWQSGDINVSGSIIASKVAELGKPSLEAIKLGNRFANLGKLFTIDNDEVLIEELDADGIIIGKKEVYGFVQTSLENGTVPTDSSMQISFVVLDDTTGGFKSVQVKEGAYRFEFNRLFTLATASVSNRLGDILSGNIGGYAIDELYPMATISHGHSEIEVGSLTQLPANNQKITFDFDTGKWETSENKEIVGEKSISGKPLVLEKEINTNISTIGMQFFLNGIASPKANTKILSKTKFEIDMSKLISGEYVYDGSSLSLSW